MMSSPRSWPHLVGSPVDEAVAQIQRDDPNLNVVKLAENSPVTYDLRFDRVRVFYDANGLVASAPSTG